MITEHDRGQLGLFWKVRKKIQPVPYSDLGKSGERAELIFDIRTLPGSLHSRNLAVLLHRYHQRTPTSTKQHCSIWPVTVVSHTDTIRFMLKSASNTLITGGIFSVHNHGIRGA